MSQISVGIDFKNYIRLLVGFKNRLFHITSLGFVLTGPHENIQVLP